MRACVEASEPVNKQESKYVHLHVRVRMLVRACSCVCMQMCVHVCGACVHTALGGRDGGRSALATTGNGEPLTCVCACAHACAHARLFVRVRR